VRTALLVLASLCELALGIVVGAGSGLLYSMTWGMVLAWATSLAVVLASPPGWRRGSFVAGWMIAVLALIIPRPEGDYLIESDVAGYVLLGLAGVMLAIVSATLPGLVPKAKREERQRAIVSESLRNPGEVP
jgi:hypothetical protein